MRNTNPLIAAGLAIAFLSLAATPSAAFQSDVPIVALYVRSAPGGGSELGFRPSESTAPASVAILQSGAPLVAGREPVCVEPPACTPRVNPVGAPCVAAAHQMAPTCARTMLGAVRVPRTFSIVDDAVLNLWLRSDRAVVLDYLLVELQKVGRDGKTVTGLVAFSHTSTQGAQVHSAPIVVQETPTQLALGSRVDKPILIEDGETLQLVVGLVQVAGGSSQAANLFAVYSQSHATGVVLPSFHTYASYAFEEMRTGDNTLGIYLDNRSLSFVPPDFEAPMVRDVSSAVGQNPSLLIWGNQTLDEDTKIAGNAVYTVLLKVGDEKVVVNGDTQPVAPGALAALQFVMSLRIGDKTFSGQTPATAAPVRSSDPHTWYVGGIVLPELELPKGTLLELGLRIIGAQPHGTVAVIFGTPEFTGGLKIPVLGGGTVLPELPVDPAAFVGPLPEPEAPAPPAPAVETPEPVPEAPVESQQGKAEGNSSPFGAVAVKKEISAQGQSPGPGATILLTLLLGLALALRQRK